MSKKACKRSKLLVEGDSCPRHDDCTLSDNWKGRIHLLKPGESAIAERIGVETPGEYAIKVR